MRFISHDEDAAEFGLATAEHEVDSPARQLGLWSPGAAIKNEIGKCVKIQESRRTHIFKAIFSCMFYMFLDRDGVTGTREVQGRQTRRRSGRAGRGKMRDDDDNRTTCNATPPRLDSKHKQREEHLLYLPIPTRTRNEGTNDPN